jgi:hypothetical protein
MALGLPGTAATNPSVDSKEGVAVGLEGAGILDDPEMNGESLILFIHMHGAEFHIGVTCLV